MSTFHTILSNSHYLQNLRYLRKKFAKKQPPIKAKRQPNRLYKGMKQNQILNYGFIERPVAALCVCAALLCVGVIVIFERGRTGQETAGQDFYAVSLKHYGMDAREMEHVPLMV